MEYCRDLVQRARNLRDTMGVKFLLTTSMLGHVIKGFLFGGGRAGIVGLPIMFLLGSYGTLTASRMQVLETIAVSPWTLKPIIGLISDTLFIAGYNKIPYILATTVIAIFACLTLVFAWPVSPTGLTCLLFLVFLQIAVADLLVEAKFTEKLVGHTEVGPDLWSFIDVGSAVCQALSIVVCGFVISYIPLNYIYFIPVPIFVALLYPMAKNWLNDAEYRYSEQFLVEDGETMEANGSLAGRDATVRHNRLSNLCCGRWLWYSRRVIDPADGPPLETPIIGVDGEKIRSNCRQFALSLLIAGISLLTSALGLAGLPSATLFVFSVLSAPAMALGFFLLTDRRIAKVQTWVILQNMCSLPFGSAAFRFYTDTALQYPEGPHFSIFFYVTVMGLLGTALYFLGVATYTLLMTRWKFRHILLTSNLAAIVFNLTNVIFFARKNMPWFGVPDSVFVIGSTALQTLTETWAELPLRVMMTQLCPAGIEATAFAMLAGSSNLGRSLAEYEGAYVLDQLGIKPTGAVGESTQFTNLWILVLIGSLLPLIPLAMIPVLIPDARQTENIMMNTQNGVSVQTMEAEEEEEDSSKEGMRGVGDQFMEITLEDEESGE
jgi:BT1 family